MMPALAYRTGPSAFDATPHPCSVWWQSAGYTTQQIADIAAKLEQAESQVQHTSRAMGYYMPERKRDESQLSKCAKDGYATRPIAINPLQAHASKLGRPILPSRPHTITPAPQGDHGDRVRARPVCADAERHGV